MRTRVENLNYGRDGEITLTEAPVQLRGQLGLYPGQNAEGYGMKIMLPWTVKWKGKTRRVYCTLISNAGTCWFMDGAGNKMIVG